VQSLLRFGTQFIPVLAECKCYINFSNLPAGLHTNGMQAILSSSITHHPSVFAVASPDRSSIIHHPSSISHLPSSIIHFPSHIFPLPSSIFHLTSSLFHHPFSINHLPSYLYCLFCAAIRDVLSSSGISTTIISISK
jgi:hypothetical protein